MNDYFSETYPLNAAFVPGLDSKNKNKTGKIADNAVGLPVGLKPGQEVLPYMDPAHGHIMPGSVVVTTAKNPKLFFEVPASQVCWN